MSSTSRWTAEEKPESLAKRNKISSKRVHFVKKKKLKINNGYYNSWGCLFKVDELPNTCDIMQTYQMTSTKGKWIERCKLVNNALASSKLQTADLGRKGSQTFYAREGNRILRFLSTFSWKDLHKINNVIESLRARSTTRINFRLGPN